MKKQTTTDARLEEIARRLFEKYNQKYFGGRLSSYRVLVTDRYGRGNHALCRTRQREIHLGTGLSGVKLKQRLLHEMAHAATPRARARGGHGKPWQAVMLRLEKMGAPVQKGEAELYRDLCIGEDQVKQQASDAGFQSDMTWRAYRPQIGLDYCSTDHSGRSESPEAARFMQELRREFMKGRRERLRYQRLAARLPRPFRDTTGEAAHITSP